MSTDERGGYHESEKARKRKKIIAATTGIVITAAVIFLIGWFVLGYWWDVNNILWSWFINGIWKPWFFPDGWNLLGATPLVWLIVLLVALFIIAGFTADDDGRVPSWLTATSILLLVAWVIVALVVIGFIMRPSWNARYYNESTTYVVSDTDNLPYSLTRIESSDRSQVGITEGEMHSSWETRVASATGATYVMQKTGDSNVNTRLMRNTVTYIYNEDGSGSWTGIRNGEKRQPIFGVVSWSGAGERVKTCEFKGDNKLNKAFSGSWGMNLNDDIKKFDPHFVYDENDVYGYCDNNDSPVIVISGVKITGIKTQSVVESYGVMTITGSPSGEPQIDFHENIEQGEFPGPVYPVNLVEKQRDALKWSAGRVLPGQPPVGFEPTSSMSQSGNSTDFLLKSKDDGRLYWVTPLKPRNTDSETIVAYSMVAADEITRGEMNEQQVYVLNNNDTNIVNFNDLENAVTQAVAHRDPGFFTGGEGNVGNIVEFVPTGMGSWNVFAERGGRAVYQINVSGGERLNTSVIKLNDDDTEELLEPETTEVTPGVGCDSPDQLSDAKIAQCISDLSQVLVDRGATSTDH